jgi:hypothetical protein
MGFPIHHPGSRHKFYAQRPLLMQFEMGGGRTGHPPAAPPNHLDASENAVSVNTVRNFDPTSKCNVVENVFNVGMLPEGMPATAWSLATHPMAILTTTSTASASKVLTGDLQVGVEVLFLLL